ncbi:MAG: hypothetical protein ACRD2X_16125 [Vicinamibacteraceae bacterium]
MARFHGKKGSLLVSSDGSSWSEVTMAQWSISREPDRQDVTSCGDSNKQSVFGLPDLSGSISGPFDPSDPAMFLEASTDDAVYLTIYPDREVTSVYAQGQAYIVLSIQGGANAPVTYSTSFAAASDWTLELATS